MAATLSPYRRLLRHPGAWVFSTSGLVARLPMAMVSLGIVLLIADRTGSYSWAGAVAATFLDDAGCAVLQARCIDRWGQGRVLAPAAAASSLGLAGFTVSVELGANHGWTYACAALAGATLPQIGASIRARWAHLIEDKAELHTAFAYESVLDEVVFIVGPALVTVLATAVHPSAGLAFAAFATICGTTVLVFHKPSQPPTQARRDTTSSVMPWPVLTPLIGCAFTMGVLLGGAEVATVAFADDRGNPKAAGLLLSIWAIGSLISGLIAGALTLRTSTATRFRWCTVALGLLVIPLPFMDSFLGVGACLFVSGCAIAPTLVAGFARIEEAVPSNRITEGIALFTTGLGAGVAPGAAMTGWIVDQAGYSAGFWVPTLAGLCGAAVALASRDGGTDPATSAAPVRRVHAPSLVASASAIPPTTPGQTESRVVRRHPVSAQPRPRHQEARGDR